MAPATLVSQNGSQSRDRGVVKRRFTWADVQPFPDNPVYQGRIVQMRREWGGYIHDIVGSPAIFDNAAQAFPEYPEDTLFVGDGNHRRVLAEEDGKLDAEFIADLYRGLTRPQMFQRRRGLNNRRTVKPAEIFLALAEENPGGLESLIKADVDGYGWRIHFVPEDGAVSCTNELKWIWKQSPTALARSIATYEAAFGAKPAAGQAKVIKGLGAFWVKYPEADFDRLMRSLRGVSVGDLYSSGRSQKQGTTFIKSVHDGIRYSLAMGYNRGQRKGRLQP